MKNVRGFIDPITLGFLLSLIGTTTVVATHDNNKVENALNSTTQVERQEIVNIEINEN